MSDHAATNQSFYDRISKAYDLLCDAGEHKARETGEQALALQPSETVLEIGFGTGNSFLHLAEAVTSSGRACGIDVSPGMEKVAQPKLDEAGVSGWSELVVGDARQLPYPDDTFDAAFSSFTIELFPLDDVPGVLQEVRRVLKPGGRLAVVSMAQVREGESKSALEKTYIWMHQHFPHIVDCQPIAVPELVAGSGLTIQKEIDMEIWSMPVRCVVATK